MTKKMMTLAEGERFATELLAAIKRHIACRAEVAGSIRRKDHSVGDVDLLIAGEPADMLAIPGMTMLMGGEKQGRCVWKDVSIDVWHVPEGCWGSMLFVKTGPTPYLIGYNNIAKHKGWKLSPYGLYDAAGNMLASETEEEIYRALDKRYKPPELRGKR